MADSGETRSYPGKVDHQLGPVWDVFGGFGLVAPNMTNLAVPARESGRLTGPLRTAEATTTTPWTRNTWPGL